MNKLLIYIMGLCLLVTGVNFAQAAGIATPDQLRLLKADLLEGKIKVGRTRLSTIQDTYGDAPNINETETRLNYDYGDLKITFDKKKYLRRTEKDYSQPIVYANNVEDLRSDLADGQIVGDYVSVDQIKKNYGEPTFAQETDKDGDWSVYYYGEVKLIFENVIIVQNWRGSGLDQAGVAVEGQVLGSKPKEEVAAPTTPPAKK